MKMTDKIDTKKLNEKLLKLAGIEFKEYDYVVPIKDILGRISQTRKAHFRGYVKDGKSINRSAYLDLVRDLNAQAKWIYPILAGKTITKSNYYKGWHTGINTDKLFGAGGNGETEPLSFALACEKLIDSLENKQ